MLGMEFVGFFWIFFLLVRSMFFKLYRIIKCPPLPQIYLCKNYYMIHERDRERAEKKKQRLMVFDVGCIYCRSFFLLSKILYVILEI